MDRLIDVGLSNALVATGLAVAAAVLGRWSRRPAVAHALWLLVLLKLVTPPVASVPIPWPRPAAVAPTAVAPALDEAPVEGRSPAPAPAPVGPIEAPPPIPSPPVVAAPAPAAEPWSWPWSWRATAGAIWLAGAGAWAALAAHRIRRLGRALRGARPAPDDVRARARDLAARIGLARCPEVVTLRGRVAPLVWALPGLRPRLVIPEALWATLDDDQRSAVLVHELAHLRRRDHWVRALELVATGLYWWHPALWWARRRLHEAEEQCCDAWVVWALPEAAGEYATALVEAVDFLAGAAPHRALSASGMGQFSHLSRRIAMIMKGRTPPRLSWLGAAALLVLAALCLPWLPTWARTPPQGQGPGPGGEARVVQSESATPEQIAPQLRAEQARAKLEWAERMVGRGYVSSGQVAQARAELLEAQAQAEAAQRGRSEAIEEAREAIEILETQLDLKRARLLGAEAQREGVAATVARYERLVARGVVSSEEKAKAESEMKVADALVIERKADLREAEIRLKQARRRLATLEQRRDADRRLPARLVPPPTAASPRPASTTVPPPRARSMNNLKQIGLALHNYLSAHDHFPPAAIRSKDGRPLLSWRVAILPYIEQEPLYREFHLDEPWDSPHNKSLIARMPKIYAAVTQGRAAPSQTFYQAFVGPRTLWSNPEGTKIQEITDGTSNTIAVVEAAEAVPWTAPADIPFIPFNPLQNDQPPPRLGGLFGGDFHALFADGSVKFLAKDLPAQVLRAALTKDGGEVMSADALRSPGTPADPAAPLPTATAPAPGEGGMMAQMRGSMGGAAKYPAEGGPGASAGMMGMMMRGGSTPADSGSTPGMMRGGMGGAMMGGRPDPEQRIAELEQQLDRLRKEVASLRRRDGASIPEPPDAAQAAIDELAQDRNNAPIALAGNLYDRVMGRAPGHEDLLRIARRLEETQPDTAARRDAVRAIAEELRALKRKDAQGGSDRNRGPTRP